MAVLVAQVTAEMAVLVARVAPVVRSQVMVQLVVSVVMAV